MVLTPHEFGGSSSISVTKSVITVSFRRENVDNSYYHLVKGMEEVNRRLSIRLSAPAINKTNVNGGVDKRFLVTPLTLGVLMEAGRKEPDAWNDSISFSDGHTQSHRGVFFVFSSVGPCVTLCVTCSEKEGIVPPVTQ